MKILNKFIGIFVMSSCLVVLLASQNVWAGNNFYKKITITNRSGVLPLPVKYTVSLPVDTEELCDNGKLKSSGEDLRVMFSGEETIQGQRMSRWRELARDIVLPIGQTLQTSTATLVYFTVEEEIAANASNSSNYILTYNDEDVTVPNYDLKQVYRFYDNFSSGNLNSWYKELGDFTITSDQRLQAQSIGLNYIRILEPATTTLYTYSYSADFEYRSGTGTFGLVLLSPESGERYRVEIFGSSLLRFRSESTVQYKDVEHTSFAEVPISTNILTGVHRLEVYKGEYFNASGGTGGWQILVYIDGQLVVQTETDTYFAYDTIVSSEGYKGLFAEDTDVIFDNITIIKRLSSDNIKSATAGVGVETKNAVYVNKISQDPPSPVGKGNIYFDFEFNTVMNTDIVPEVKVVTSNGQEISLIGIWTGDNVYYCRGEVTDTAGDGPATIKLRNAMGKNYYGLNCSNFKNTSQLTVERNARVISKDITVEPNPFSPNNDGVLDTTQILFKLTKDEYVSIRIFDVSGRLKRTIKDQRYMGAGANAVTWDGKDDAGVMVPQGIYMWQINAGETMKLGSVIVSK
ncbi:MAG: FlgD immunoglobulin-like domain containing protein [Elusimicrobiota bacterium]